MTLETPAPLESAIGSAEANGRDWNAFSPSLPDLGRGILPLREFNFHPLGSWLAQQRGPLLFWGLRAYFRACRQWAKEEVPYQNRIITVCVEPSEDVG